MKNDIAQGPTFRNKLTAIEHEIMTLEEETKALENDRKAAQLSAHSGEHIHQNVQTLMENIDRVPPEIQKDLLRALIQNIVIHDNKIVMNVFIQPEGLIEAAEKEKTPTPTECQDEGFKGANCDPVAPKGPVSQWRQAKGGSPDPELYHSINNND